MMMPIASSSVAWTMTGRQAVRQHVRHHDAQRADALQAAGGDVVVAGLGQRAGVGDAGQGRDVENAQQDQQLDLVAEGDAGDGERADAEDADQRDGPDQQRDRGHRVQQAHQQLLQPAAAEESRQQAERDAADAADDDGAQADLQRGAAAPDDAAEDVAAGLVGAEPVAGPGFGQ